MLTVSHSGRLLAPLLRSLDDPGSTREEVIHRLLDAVDILIQPGTVFSFEGERAVRHWEEVYLEVHATLFAGRQHCHLCQEAP